MACRTLMQEIIDRATEIDGLLATGTAIIGTVTGIGAVLEELAQIQSDLEEQRRVPDHFPPDHHE